MSESEVDPAPLGMPTDEPTESNAGEDAIMGTVAEMPPTDIGDQKPMDEGLSDPPEPEPKSDE